MSRREADKLYFYAEYNDLEYRIYNSKSELVYSAGNSPFDSQDYVSSDEGVGLRKMREYAIQTGNEIAKEQNGIFIGAEYFTPTEV